MSRPLRIEYPGAFYHVMNRGLERRDIFNTPENFQYFLGLLSALHEKYGLMVHSYCLMSNHYHLYIETPNGDLSKIMRQLDGVYTQKFNKLNKRVGPLFQGRYKAILIDQESYSLQLSQYIHLNPVKAKLVHKPDQYKWSSYPAIIDKVKKPDFLDISWLLAQFHRSRKRAITEFKKYTLGGIDHKWLPEEDIYKGTILGSEDFVSFIRDKFLDNRKADREVPLLQIIQKKVTPNDVEETLKKYRLNPKLENKLMIYALKKFTNLTLREIGRRTGKNHYSAVTHAVNRLIVAAKKDRSVYKLIQQIERDCKMSNVKT